MKHWILAGVVLVVSVVGLAQDAEPPTDLRPRFVEGRTTRYALWTVRRTNVNMSVGDRSQSGTTNMQVEGEVTWRVDRVDEDGSASCTMSLDWLKATFTGTNGDVQMSDSRQGSGDNEAMHGLLQAMSGAPLELEMAADGSVTAIKGVDAIKSAAGEDTRVPSDLDFMETASDLATLPFAPTELAMGDGYDAQFAWSHDLGTLHHDQRYTLKSIEQIAGIPIANVDARADLRLEPDLSKLPEGGAGVDVNLEQGEVVTQVMFDLQRHEAVGRNATQTTVIRVKIPVPAANQTLVRTMEEVIQSQALRIAEE